MRAYRAHLRMSLKEGSRYFFSDALIAAMSVVVFISLGVLFYQATGKDVFFGQFTWAMLAWYLIVTQLLITSQANVIRIVSDHVQRGEIVTYMAKPVHYPVVLLMQHAGTVIVETAAMLVFAIPVGLAVAGTSALSIGGVVFGIVVIVLALLIDFALSMSLGLIAFWTEDANPYAWIYGKLIFMLGGLLFPLDIFPAWLQGIAKLLPPAFMLYYPARLVVDFSWSLLFRVIIGQLVYLALFAGIAYLIYKRALKRVSVNGG